MAKNGKKSKSLIASGIWCVVAVVILFGYLGMVMGGAQHAQHDNEDSPRPIAQHRALSDEYMCDNRCHWQSVR